MLISIGGRRGGFFDHCKNLRNFFLLRNCSSITLLNDALNNTYSPYIMLHAPKMRPWKWGGGRAGGAQSKIQQTLSDTHWVMS